MALNKYAAIRYRIIDECIRSRSAPYPSKESLRQACEEALYGTSDGSNISLSTVDKDIWALKNESVLGYAPISFSRAHNGYYYTDPDFSLSLPLNREDISLIRLALQTLTHFKETRLFRDLETAVNKIQGRIMVADHLADSHLEKVIQFETVSAGLGHELLPQVLEAIRQHQEIEFRYTPHVDGISRQYRFHPYLLKENKNLWYLVGMETGSGRIRTLGLDRMDKVGLTGSTFLEDQDFNPDLYFRYSFGIGTYSGKPEEIMLRFDPVQSRYIRSNPLHPTQELINEDDGCTVIRIYVIPSDELKMQILSYGPKVEVISPEWLRLETAQMLKRAAQQYR